jgi:hypothetical protein
MHTYKPQVYFPFREHWIQMIVGEGAVSYNQEENHITNLATRPCLHVK